MDPNTHGTAISQLVVRQQTGGKATGTSLQQVLEFLRLTPFFEFVMVIERSIDFQGGINVMADFAIDLP